MPFLKYKSLKLKLRAFLAGHSVAMVTYCVRKIVPTCSPMIGQFFDTMIVASIDPSPKWRPKIQIGYNKLKLKTHTSTRKNTFTLVTLQSFSIKGVISAEKMYVEN